MEQSCLSGTIRAVKESVQASKSGIPKGLRNGISDASSLLIHDRQSLNCFAQLQKYEVFCL